MLFPVLWRPSIAENFVLFYVSIRFALERQSQVTLPPRREL